MIAFQIARQTENGVQQTQHSIEKGYTVLQALIIEHIPLSIHSETHYTIGVWSRLIKPNQLLCEGDRIELYYPLRIDPKESRRLRVHTTLAQKETKKNAANRANKLLKQLKYRSSLNTCM